MRRLLKILAVIGAVLVLLVAAGVFALDRYVGSPAFKQQVLTAAHQALGADVRINELAVSLLSGVTLRGVTIANPPGFPGELLTAEAFVLRYRLLPLLQGRVEVDHLSLTKPALSLVRGETGKWNYESMGASAPGPPAPGAGLRGPALDIALSKVMISRGEVVLIAEKQRLLARLSNLDVAASIDWTRDRLRSNGRASIETLTAADSLFARRITARVDVSSDEVRLAPFTGRLADGDVSGDATLNLRGGLGYTVNAQVRDSDVEKILREAGLRTGTLSGKLQVSTSLAGRGGLPTIVGSGRAELTGGRVIDVPLLTQLAVLLQIPVLRDLTCTECRLEFTVSEGVMRTPVVRLIARDAELTGRGAVSLTTYTLDHELTLALSKDALGRAPKQIRTAFTERADGFSTLSFRVWGPYDAPKTDLPGRLTSEAARELLQKGLEKGLKQLFR